MLLLSFSYTVACCDFWLEHTAPSMTCYLCVSVLGTCLTWRRRPEATITGCHEILAACKGHPLPWFGLHGHVALCHCGYLEVNIRLFLQWFLGLIIRCFSREKCVFVTIFDNCVPSPLVFFGVFFDAFRNIIRRSRPQAWPGCQMGLRPKRLKNKTGAMR